MSKNNEQLEESNSPEETIDPTDLLDGVKSFLATLVPPTKVEIEDIFANKYDLTCSVSARNQIKILREFDKLKELPNVDFLGESNEGGVTSIVKTIINVATDETALLIICRCFSIGHAPALSKAKEHAKNIDHEFEDNDYACADLFALEELVTAIVPLFIRLAKRSSQAITAVMNGN